MTVRAFFVDSPGVEFLQAQDGVEDRVQQSGAIRDVYEDGVEPKIGRASCRERVS
jgi:hypothetical protein